MYLDLQCSVLDGEGLSFFLEFPFHLCQILHTQVCFRLPSPFIDQQSLSAYHRLFFLPIPRCLDYSSFIISLQIGDCRLYKLLFQNCFDYLIPLPFSRNAFWKQSVSSLKGKKKSCWIFTRIVLNR